MSISNKHLIPYPYLNIFCICSKTYLLLVNALKVLSNTEVANHSFISLSIVISNRASFIPTARGISTAHFFYRELPEKVTLKLPFSHQNSPKSNLFHPQNR